MKRKSKNTGYFAYTTDFVYCPSCRKVYRGSQFTCPQCYSEDTKVYSRVTGYYSVVNMYNPGKRKEWEARKREKLFKYVNVTKNNFCKSKKK